MDNTTNKLSNDNNNGSSSSSLSQLSNEEIVQLSDQLYDALTVTRHTLSNFLEKDPRYVTYDVLFRMFQNMQKKYDYREGNMVSDLLLGLIGPEYNKQKAVYEIPTYELLATIFAIITYFDIKSVEELMAGQGLFASLFNKFFVNKDKLNFNASDGQCQCETSAIGPYYPIEKKYIIEYLLEKKNDKPEEKVYITLWPSTANKNTYLQEFITKIRPQFFILVGQKDIYKEYFKHFAKEKYREITFIPYQLCYKDTVSNSNSLNDIYHSSVTVFINESVKSNLEENSNDIKKLVSSIMLDKTSIFRAEQKIDDKYLLKYFAEERLIPRQIINNTLSDTEIKEFIKYLYEISESKISTNIPEYLTTLTEFKFWYQLHVNHKFPKLLKTYGKFKEFQNIYEKIDLSPFVPSNIMEMKNKNILPIWVNNKQDALKCLILEYSTTVKQKSWKQSQSFFERCMQSMRAL